MDWTKYLFLAPAVMIMGAVVVLFDKKASTLMWGILSLILLSAVTCNLWIWGSAIIGLALAYIVCTFKYADRCDKNVRVNGDSAKMMLLIIGLCCMASFARFFS